MPDARSVGVEPAQIAHRSPRFVNSASKRMTGSDNSNRDQKAGKVA